MRESFGQLPQAGAFEALVPDDHRSRSCCDIQKRFDKALKWRVPRHVEKGVVPHRAITRLGVARELEGQLLERSRAKPARDHEGDRLEVEIAPRVGYFVQELPQLVGDEDRVAAGGVGHAQMHCIAQLSRRHVAQVKIPGAPQPVEQRTRARQHVNGELRTRRFGRAAMRKERALVGIDALAARGGRRHRADRYLLQRFDDAGDLRQQRLDLCRYVGNLQQPLKVSLDTIDKTIVDVSEQDAGDVAPRTARNPGLDRAIPDMLLLHRSRGLHLNQGVVIAMALERIDTDADALVRERWLEQHRHLSIGPRQEGISLGQCFAHVHVVRGDEYATTQKISCKVTEPRALVEPGLCGSSPIAGLTIVQLKPQALVALAAGLDTRLGEAGLAIHRDELRLAKAATIFDSPSTEGLSLSSSAYVSCQL